MDTLSKDDLKSAIAQEQGTQIKDLSAMIDEMNNKRKPVHLDPYAEIKEIVSHNTVTLNAITEELAQEITVINLVIRELVKHTGIDMEELSANVKRELEALNQEDVQVSDDGHPSEATVFGG
jgi:hypothetical protein